MRAVVVLDVARPAGRVGTRKTIMYVLACAFLSFSFFALSVHFLPAEEDVYTGRYVFPRELNVGSFTTFLGVDLLIFDPVLSLLTMMMIHGWVACIWKDF